MCVAWRWSRPRTSYPLTVSLLGIPGVKTIRSYSFFGFSSVYIIFKEDVDFYWSRSRVLEKLSSLPAGTLPQGIQPALGPDATALGQVYWYTLEGRDPDGQPAGGWDQVELAYASLEFQYAASSYDVSFLDLLDSVQTLLSFELEQVRAARDWRAAAADLAFLTGGAWPTGDPETVEAPGDGPADANRDAPP